MPALKFRSLIENRDFILKNETQRISEEAKTFTGDLLCLFTSVFCYTCVDQCLVEATLAASHLTFP